jgi:GT2 family glycosyltransferase
VRFDIIIAHYGSGALTEVCRRCLVSVRKYSHNYRLIFVDNNSPDLWKLEPEIRQQPHLLIRNTENTGFVKAVNQGLWSASAERIVILNNDTAVVPGWLEKLDAALIGDIGIAGPRTTTPNSWQGRWPAGKGIIVLPAGAMLAFFCAMIRHEVFQKVGYLDQNFGIGLGDDDDYCYRARLKGFRLALVLDLVIPHYHRSTFRTLYTEAEIQSMQRAALRRLRAKYPGKRF